MQQRKVLVVVGPTASGKSALGVKLAKKFGGEIISADSRQVYRGLDIGTGKISKREMRGVRHHLLDVTSPKKKFSAGDFAQHAQKAIAQMSALPIIVGGTGFYIDALLGNVTLADVPPNPRFRAKHNKYAAAQLMRMLKKTDPERARKMDTPSERNNKVRLIRALEIAAARNVSPKAHREVYDVLWIGINPPFTKLEKNISHRLTQRVKAGMISEARRLRESGLSLKRMEELGLEYRSLARFLKKEIAKEEMVAELQRDIRRYGKKQLMYWKRNKEIAWFDPKDTKGIQTLVKQWLNTSPYVSAGKAR